MEEGGLGILWKSLINYFMDWTAINQMLCPVTPKSDQFLMSPTAAPEICHQTVWRTWLFIAYSKMTTLPILTTSRIHFSLKGWEDVLFELGNERLMYGLID